MADGLDSAAAFAHVLVDGRWQGTYGIGRFSREVFTRLEPPHLLRGGPAPASPTDPLFLRRMQRRSGLPFLYSPGFSASLLSRVPQLLTVHDLAHVAVPADSSAAKRAYFDLIVRPAVHRAGMVLTVSDFSKRALLDWTGLPPDDVLVVGDGCSAAFTHHGDAYDPGFPYVLYVGNARPHKNLGLLTRSFAHLPADWGLVAVTALNDGPDPFAALRASRRVMVAFGVSDHRLATFYRGALVTALPSTYEGFGLPAVESLACGTPVASLESCEAITEVTSDAGLRSPSATDGAAFAHVMVEVVEDRDTFAAAARSRAAAYDWDQVAECVAAGVSEFVARHR